MKLTKHKILIYSITIVLLGLIWLTIDIVKVSSNSMLPTYNDGDYLISLNTDWFLPKLNDIVVFKKHRKLLIKRIVPIKDKKIYSYNEFSFSTELASKNKNKVKAIEYIVPQKNQYIKGSKNIKKYQHFIERETKKKIIFRDGAYYLGIKKITQYQFKNNFFFVEGDNKKVSFDSRKFGVIPEKDIIGKIACKLW